jgi:sulfur-oxidizing protein SoxX
VRLPAAAGALLATAALLAGTSPAQATLPATADGLPQALGSEPGDPQRGRAIVGNRQQGICLLCHNGPAALFPHEATPGNVAGSLAGVGTRYSRAQLRLRVADARALNPASVMPTYLPQPAAAGWPEAAVDTATRRVAAAWQGRSLLTPQQVEDVVAFLETLR